MPVLPPRQRCLSGSITRALAQAVGAMALILLAGHLVAAWAASRPSVNESNMLFCTRPDFVLFHHFPKAAGSQLRTAANSLVLQLDDSPLQFVYHRDETTPAFNTTNPPAAFLMGHELTFDFHRRFLPPSRTHIYVTMFREPLSWWLSAFFQSHTPQLPTFTGDHKTSQLFLTWMEEQVKGCPRLLGSSRDASAPCADRYANWYIYHWAHFLPTMDTGSDSASNSVDTSRAGAQHHLCQGNLIRDHMEHLGIFVLLTEEYEESLNRLFRAFGLTRPSSDARANSRSSALYARNLTFDDAKKASDLTASTCMDEIYSAARSIFRHQGDQLDFGKCSPVTKSNLPIWDPASSRTLWHDAAVPPTWSTRIDQTSKQTKTRKRRPRSHNRFGSG